MTTISGYNLLKPGLELLVPPDTRAARINSIPLNSNPDQEEHWKAISEVARALWYRGIHVVVEARFRHGGRADIYIPSMFMIIEVLHSETPSLFWQKISKHYTGTKVRIGWITTTEAQTLGAIGAMNLAFSRAKKVIA